MCIRDRDKMDDHDMEGFLRRLEHLVIHQEMPINHLMLRNLFNDKIKHSKKLERSIQDYNQAKLNMTPESKCTLSLEWLVRAVKNRILLDQ